MSKKNFALVKWIGGCDDKKYTAGIDVGWIKDFDYSKYKNDEEEPDKIYLVEWHDPKKEPLGGWTCFNAMIIAVSASIKVLEKKLGALDGIKSPSKVITQDGEDNLSGKRKADRYEEVDSEASTSKQLVYSETDLQHQTPDLEFIQDVDANEDLEPIRLVHSNRTVKSPVASTSKKLVRRETDLQHQTPEMNVEKRNNSSSDKTLKSHGALANNFVTKEYLREALSEMLNLIERNLNKTDNSSQRSSSQLGDENADPELKELGSKGSGVFVSQHQWNAVKAKSTFTSMGIALVMATFDRETLLRSNYKGGKSKIKKNDEVQFSALNPKIISAIKDTVRCRFKHTYDEAKFGIAVNNKLTSFRRDNRKKNISNEGKDKESGDSD